MVAYYNKPYNYYTVSWGTTSSNRYNNQYEWVSIQNDPTPAPEFVQVNPLDFESFQKMMQSHNELIPKRNAQVIDGWDKDTND